MSDNINLRISGQFHALPNSDVKSTEKPASRFELLKVGGEEGVGITGEMKSGKIKVEVGEGQNPPDTHGTGKARGKAIKDFFHSIGQGIKGLFQKAADGLNRLTENFRLRNDAAVNVTAQGKEIAKAVKANDPDALATALRGIIKQFHVEAKREGLSVDQVIERSFNLKGSDGHALLPEDVGPMKAMLPALRQELASFPGALKYIEHIESFDYQTAYDESLSADIDKLRNVDLKTGMGNAGLGTFLRANTFFSAAMKEHQNKYFDPVGFGSTLVAKHSEAINDIVGDVKEYNKVSDEKIPKIDNKIGNPFATDLMNLTRGILDDMIKVEGPEGMKARFGETHLALLKETAEKIASQQDILPELRNEALFKLYNNDLFLRGVVPAITVDPGAMNIELGAGRLVGGLVQSVLNNANGTKMGDDMRDAFIPVRDEYQTKLTQAFVALGMPVVPTN